MLRSTPLNNKKIEGHHCTVDLRLEKLGMVPFFKDLSDAQLQEVNKKFSATHFLRDEEIYAQNEQARMLRVVVHGNVKLARQTMECKDIVLDMLKPGEFFGSLSALGDKVYRETALAHIDVCSLSIGLNDFYSILQEYSSVALAVLDITSGRLQSAHEQIHHLSTFPVEKRIANILIRLCEKFGEEGSQGNMIQLPLSRKDLADMAGTSTETASRIMSQFKEDGLINSGREWVAIIDQNHLSEIASS